jgi:hypothetical protein
MVVSGMEIKTPSQGANGGTVTVPVVLTLGTHDISVSGFSLTVEYYGFAGVLIEGTISPTIPP